MFYQGSLQEGISMAVGQQKMVLCFVTNEDDESQRWEKEFLQDGCLKELLQLQAVALRLTAGSESAGYLAQIFPLPKTPTVVIMKHGELKEYIASGTSKEDFLRRVQSAFNVSAPPPGPASEQAAPAMQTAEPAPETGRSESVSRVLAERAARLQAKKEEAERRAKEERAKAKAKAEAEAAAGANTDAAHTHKQAELLKQRRQQAAEERRRILKRIEDDKAERRQRAAEREQRRIDALKTGDVAAALVRAPETRLPSTTRVGDMTALQFRLFDGSTLRSRFATAAPFTDVRAWVDENRADDKLPYTFRQLLTPTLNKAIDATEETKTLRELGLAPSATLILIPVQNFSSAYDEGASQGLLSRIIGVILGFCTWLMGLVGLGAGREAPPATVSESPPQPPAQEKDSRFRRFQDPHDHQFYNGNSLSFEPRPDDEDDV